MSIRPATEGDYDAFARLYPELKTGDLVPERRVWTADIAPSTLVLEEAGRVVAYGFSTHVGPRLRVRHIVIDPALRGRGLGRHLMLELARRAREAGCTTWELAVLPHNTAARTLYERLGMRVTGEGVALKFLWSQVAAVPTRTELVCTQAQPADDAAIEARFRLAPGRIAKLRPEQGMQLFVVRGADPIEGFAAFSPSFPGALPFAAQSVEAAGALLRAMQPHGRPDIDWVRVVLENDEPLAQQLLSHGATVHLRTLHMEGPLPA